MRLAPGPVKLVLLHRSRSCECSESRKRPLPRNLGLSAQIQPGARALDPGIRFEAGRTHAAARRMDVRRPARPVGEFPRRSTRRLCAHPCHRSRSRRYRVSFLCRILPSVEGPGENLRAQKSRVSRPLAGLAAPRHTAWRPAIGDATPMRTEDKSARPAVSRPKKPKACQRPSRTLRSRSAIRRWSMSAYRAQAESTALSILRGSLSAWVQ